MTAESLESATFYLINSRINLSRTLARADSTRISTYNLYLFVRRDPSGTIRRSCRFVSFALCREEDIVVPSARPSHGSLRSPG